MTPARLAVLATTIIAVAPAAPGHAWNDLGHMSVAYVAYQRLTPPTRARVNALLALNPYFATKWASAIPPGTSAEDRDLMIFMIAATWPDQIKRDGTYKNDGSHNGDRPDGPFAKRNSGYGDHLRHKYWHFVDTPFTRDSTPLPPIPSPNAETQIGVFRKVLASSRPDPLKSYDLSWLLHLVGDVHQPLHCATRVSQADPEGDAGGNGVKLVAACTGCDEKLHAYWDDRLGTAHSPADAIAAAKTLPAPGAALAAKSHESDWVKEGFDAAEQSVYVTPIGDNDGPFTLTTTYGTKARSLVRKRIALAGARLANLLNHDLK